MTLTFSENSNHGWESLLEGIRQNIAGWCQQTFWIQKFVESIQQCFAFTPIIWIFTEGVRWWDWIQNIFLNIFFLLKKIKFWITGIVPDDILDALKKKKLGLPGIDVEAPEEKNDMMAGRFEVIRELLEAYSKDDQGKIAKAQVSFTYFDFQVLIFHNFFLIVLIMRLSLNRVSKGWNFTLS